MQPIDVHIDYVIKQSIKKAKDLDTFRCIKQHNFAILHIPTIAYYKQICYSGNMFKIYDICKYVFFCIGLIVIIYGFIAEPRTFFDFIHDFIHSFIYVIYFCIAILIYVFFKIRSHSNYEKYEWCKY